MGTSGCTGRSWSARYDVMSSSVHVASGLTLTRPNEASQLTIGASARVGPSERFSDGQPGALAGDGAAQRLHLAELAALLAATGVRRRLGTGLGHGEVQLVALPHLLDEGQRLGEVRLGVQEDDLDPGRDLGHQVDQHDVLEGGGQDQGVAERLDGPADDRAGRRGLEPLADVRQSSSALNGWSLTLVSATDPHLLSGAIGPGSGGPSPALDARPNAGFSIHDQNGHDSKRSHGHRCRPSAPPKRPPPPDPAAAAAGGSVTRPGQAGRAPPGPPRPPGVAGHLHHPGGGGRVRAPRPPLQRRQGLRRPAAPGLQGLQARAHPLPGPARRHGPQLPRGPRLPGRPGRGRGGAPPRGQGAGLHRPGPGGRPRARRRRATASRRRRCSTPSTPTGSTPPSAAPGATRTRPGPRSVCCRSATPSASGTPSAQRPELWQLYQGSVRPGEHLRAFPLSDWTELDIWQYIRRERIELPSIYYAHEREVVERDGMLLALSEWVHPAGRRGGPQGDGALPHRRRRHVHRRRALGRRHRRGDHPRGLRVAHLRAGCHPGRRPLLRDRHGGPQARGVLLGP